MSNYLLRKGVEAEAKADPLSRILDPLADKIGWSPPRNWVSAAESGDWSFAQETQESFIEWLDYIYFFAAAGLVWLTFHFAGQGNLLMSIVSMVYLLMLLISALTSAVEEIKKTVLGFAFINFGEESKQKDYFKWGVIGGLSFIVLSLLSSGLGQQEIGLVIIESFIMGVLINVVCIPMAEELILRGVYTAYLAEAAGIIPAIIISSIMGTLYHMAVYILTPYAIAMTFIASMIFASLTLWKKALLPALIAHALINLASILI